MKRFFLQTAIPLRLWSDIAMLALLAMEAFWMTNWYAVLAHPRAGWLSVDLYLTATLLTTHLLARTSPQWRLTLNRRRWVFGAWLLLPVLAGFPLVLYGGQIFSAVEIWERTVASFTQFGSDLGEFWHILILLLVATRGLRLAHDPLQTYTAQTSFQLGLYLLLLYGLLYGWSNPSQAISTTYGFLFCAVLAMSAARISTLSELRGGRLPPLRSFWLPGLLVVAGLVVGLAVALGWLATDLAADLIAMVTLLLFSVVMIAGVIVFFPLILLILSLGPSLRDLIESLLNFSGFENLRKLLQTMAARVGITPEWVENAARTSRPVTLVAILVGLLVIALIAVAWKPWQRRWLPEGTAALLPLQAALHFPRLFLGRFSGRLPNGGGWLAAARVRWVYAQLMQLCARLGKPRPPASTPLEFLPAAQELFPGAEATLEQITQAYLKVRYGELPETYAEVQQVLLGWEDVKARGQQMRARHRRTLKFPRLR